MDQELKFLSENKDGSRSTILFLHSLFSSAYQWTSTVHYIEKRNATYHFLRPSLEPSQITSQEVCIRLLAELIAKEAIGGKAHIVGLSIGAHIAVLLAHQHPQLVETLNISGYQGFSKCFQPLLPISIYLLKKMATLHMEAPPFSFAQSRGVAHLLLSSDTVRALPIKTIIYVGMRPDLFNRPNDKPEVARALAKRLGGNIPIQGGKEMGHLWCIHYHCEYADAIVDFIEDWRTERPDRKFHAL